MYFLRTPEIFKSFLPGNLTWDIPSEEHTIYLTFDDGPTPLLTYDILNILSDFNARATFFCVGENATRFADQYQAIIDKGHSVANHTFNHLNGWKTSTKSYLANVELCRQVIDSRLFRPPYGMIKPAQNRVLRKDYQVIMWSVLSGDFDPGVSAEQCLANVSKYAGAGSIVVFHDHEKTAAKVQYALPRFLEESSKKGFRFNGI